MLMKWLQMPLWLTEWHLVSHKQVCGVPVSHKNNRGESMIHKHERLGAGI